MGEGTSPLPLRDKTSGFPPLAGEMSEGQRGIAGRQTPTIPVHSGCAKNPLRGSCAQPTSFRHFHVIPAKAGIHRPLSRRKGTRASEARSQGYAGGDEGPDGLSQSPRFPPLAGEMSEGQRGTAGRQIPTILVHMDCSKLPPRERARVRVTGVDKWEGYGKSTPTDVPTNFSATTLNQH